MCFWRSAVSRLVFLSSFFKYVHLILSGWIRAVLSGFYLTDIAFYFPESFVLATVPWFRLPSFFFPQRKWIEPFRKSFSGSFLNFVFAINTTLKWDPSDITPAWELWYGLLRCFSTWPKPVIFVRWGRQLEVHCWKDAFFFSFSVMLYVFIIGFGRMFLSFRPSDAFMLEF